MIQAFAIRAFHSVGRTAFALLALACISSAAFAQSAAYPTRPVRLLLGFAPGGATDVVARILQQSISEHLGQPLVIENRPGASGMIATQELVRAAPDGYTLAIIVSAHAGMAALQRNLPFDPIRDIAPITLCRACRIWWLWRAPRRVGSPIPPPAPEVGRNLA
jgi:tripartite-type tricarboxylate transporter receptor subunit TctC